MSAEPVAHGIGAEDVLRILRIADWSPASRVVAAYVLATIDEDAHGSVSCFAIAYETGLDHETIHAALLETTRAMGFYLLGSDDGHGMAAASDVAPCGHAFESREQLICSGDGTDGPNGRHVMSETTYRQDRMPVALAKPGIRSRRADRKRTRQNRKRR